MSGCAFNGVAVITGEFGDNLQKGGTLVLHRLAIAVEPRLILCTQHGHTGFEVRKTFPNVVH